MSDISNSATSSPGLLSFCRWRHGGHIWCPKTMKRQPPCWCSKVFFFLCERFLLFQEIWIDASQVSENALLVSFYSIFANVIQVILVHASGLQWKIIGYCKNLKPRDLGQSKTEKYFEWITIPIITAKPLVKGTPREQLWI